MERVLTSAVPLSTNIFHSRGSNRSASLVNNISLRSVLVSRLNEGPCVTVMYVKPPMLFFPETIVSCGGNVRILHYRFRLKWVVNHQVRNWCIILSTPYFPAGKEVKIGKLYLTCLALTANLKIKKLRIYKDDKSLLQDFKASSTMYA